MHGANPDRTASQLLQLGREQGDGIVREIDVAMLFRGVEAVVPAKKPIIKQKATWFAALMNVISVLLVHGISITALSVAFVLPFRLFAFSRVQAQSQPPALSVTFDQPTHFLTEEQILLAMQPKATVRPSPPQNIRIE